MRTGIGYLTAVQNVNWSGIATVTFRSRKHRTPKHPGKTVTTYCEAGYGVRQLVAAVGGELTQAAGNVRLRYTIDDMGLLQSVEPLD